MQNYTKSTLPTNQHKLSGINRLKEGKVAAIFLAAGTGSRLGIKMPKALFPLVPEKSHTLLSILCEKALFTESVVGTSLPIAIMCSEKNRKEIQQYLEKNAFFGLKNVELFEQKAIQHPSGEISSGGNGDLYHFLEKAEILPRWKALGIEEVSLIPIDNPLAEPFDPALIGFRFENVLDAAMIAIKNEEEEKKHMGALVDEGGEIRILEYYENEELAPDVCNANLFCFSRSFLERAAKLELPYHCLKRKTGKKQERFFFDALIIAEKTGALLYPKESCFAPLKTQSGQYGIEETKKAFLKQRKKLLGENG